MLFQKISNGCEKNYRLDAAAATLYSRFITHVIHSAELINEKGEFMSRSLRGRIWGSCLLLALMALAAFGQSAPATTQSAPPTSTTDSSAKPADPQPLPMPSMSGPLQTAPPRQMDSGKLAVTGILSGMGFVQGNHLASDTSAHWDVTNAQVFVQKPTGWWQYYLQGGAYNL